MQNFRKEIYKWKRNINRLSGTTWSVTYIKEWLFSSHKYRYFYNKGRYFLWILQIWLQCRFNVGGAL